MMNRGDFIERRIKDFTAVEFEERYAKRYTKKFSDKPEVIQVIAHRTLGTATSVLAELQGVPFEQLALSIYLYCKDAGFSPIANQYGAQIELAGANPDKFVFGLHSFYNKVVKEISSGKLWREFMGFMSACVELKYLYTGHDEIHADVVTAYIDLLIQTTEYSRPDRFNLRQVLIGVSTTGELLTGEAFYPHSDQPAIEVRKMMAAGKKPAPHEIEAMLTRMYREQGISIKTPADAAWFQEIQKIRDNTYMVLMPYINEYTADILPKMEFQNERTPVGGVVVLPAPDAIQAALRARKRTLPANGVTVEFTDPLDYLLELLMKEVVYEDAVVMLYRLESSFGDLCGYYNTQTGFFYSVTIEMRDTDDYAIIRELVLYCYALATTNVFDVNEVAVLRGGEPLGIQLFNVGGRLRDVYHAGESGEGVGRSGNPDFEMQQAAVNGYIRRLPAGQSASNEALNRARRMGYDLAPDETYVQPFTKTVFTLRRPG